MPDPDLHNQFEEEMKRMQEGTVLSPEFRRRKIISWVIRTAIAVFLYYMLWDYKWVRWTLLIYIPINLVSILSVIGWSFLLNKKMEVTRQMMEQAQRGHAEEAEFEIMDDEQYRALEEDIPEDPEIQDAEFEELDDDDDESH